MAKQVQRTVTLQVVPATTGPPGPSMANCVIVDGPLDQLWLPWMVRFATSGSPAENQLIVEINCGWQHHLITTPCMSACYNSGLQMSDLGSDSICRLVKLDTILMLIF